jgi:hypothetical protein
VDLIDVTWEGRGLSGRSRVVGRDAYELVVSVPPGYVFDRVECEGAAVVEAQRDGAVLAVTLMTDQSREITWSLFFSSLKPPLRAGGSGEERVPLAYPPRRRL